MIGTRYNCFFKFSNFPLFQQIAQLQLQLPQLLQKGVCQLFNEVPHLTDKGFLVSTSHPHPIPLIALWPTEARPPEVGSCLSEWIHSSRSQNPAIINLNLAFDQISLLPEWSATSKPCGLWTPVTRRLLRLQRKKCTQAELSQTGQNSAIKETKD